jgi:ABC-type transport system involved in multi-copper enzyme maturation permease subunit
MNATVTLARKEAGELLRSGRGLAWLLMVCLVLSGFGLLLIGDVELSLLDNAQVVYDMTATVTALGALLAVVTGADAVAGERERGSLIPLLLMPIPRSGIVLGKIGGQVVAWAVTLCLAAPYLWAVGSTGQNLRAAYLATLVLGTPIVLGFGLLAIGLGARLATARATLLTSLIGLMFAASPLLFGPSLRQTAIGRGFDQVNPFAAALNAYDAMIIDSERLAAQGGHLLVALCWLALALWFALTGVHRLARGQSA